MRLVCTLYYLMPVKQVSVPSVVVVMMLLVTSKAGAKPESSTVPVRKENHSCTLHCQKPLQAGCAVQTVLWGAERILWGWAGFFSIICSSTVTTYLRQLGQLLSS